MIIGCALNRTRTKKSETVGIVLPLFNRAILYVIICIIRQVQHREPRDYDTSLLLLVLLFVASHIHGIGCQPKKLLYMVTNSARGLLNREKRTKEKVWQLTPSPPYAARSEKIK